MGYKEKEKPEVRGERRYQIGEQNNQRRDGNTHNYNEKAVTQPTPSSDKEKIK